jgi:hypothetical protein
MSKLSEFIIPFLGLVFIVLKWHLSHISMRKDLFKEFNDRYKEMNSKLQDIVEDKPEFLTSDQKDTLIDYFNLCAEEYYWRMRVFCPPIDGAIWKSWTKGMIYYYDIPVVKKLWQSEILIQCDKINKNYKLYYLKWRHRNTFFGIKNTKAK